MNVTLCTRGWLGCGDEYLRFIAIFCKYRGESANKKEKPYICHYCKDRFQLCLKFEKMAERNETGKDGEAAAREYLEKQGYVIAHTNWHWHHYELDIVAVCDNELVVVEVKTRSEDFLLSPEEAVDSGKIRRIVAAADAYARFFNVALPIRFDIVSLIKKQGGYEIEHIEDAFYAPCH